MAGIKKDYPTNPMDANTSIQHSNLYFLVDGKTTDYYKPKWSNSTTGQVKYAGWDPAAYTRMAELQEWVQKFRDDDANNDKKNQKYALTVIQEKNKKKIDKKQPKKKQSRKEPPKDSAKKPPKIVRLEE